MDDNSPVAALEAPGCQDRLDQLSACIGQITRILASLTHRDSFVDTPASAAVGIEDLTVRNLLKNGKLARAITYRGRNCAPCWSTSAPGTGANSS